VFTENLLLEMAGSKTSLATVIKGEEIAGIYAKEKLLESIDDSRLINPST
jgi:hypothetical protein